MKPAPVHLTFRFLQSTTMCTVSHAFRAYSFEKHVKFRTPVNVKPIYILIACSHPRHGQDKTSFVLSARVGGVNYKLLENKHAADIGQCITLHSPRCLSGARWIVAITECIIHWRKLGHDSGGLMASVLFAISMGKNSLFSTPKISTGVD